MRPYWQKYLGRAAVLVFVVDSSRTDLFVTAKVHLQELVAQDPLLPLVVLANKQVRGWGLILLSGGTGVTRVLVYLFPDTFIPRVLQNSKGDYPSSGGDTASVMSL